MKKASLYLAAGAALLLSSQSFAAGLPSFSSFKSVKLLPAGKFPLPTKSIKYDFTSYPKVTARYFVATGKDYAKEGEAVFKLKGKSSGKIKITEFFKKK